MPEDKKAPENKKPEVEAPAEEAAPVLSESTKAEMKAGKASLMQYEKQQAAAKAAEPAEPELPPDEGHFPVAEGDDKYTGHPPTQKKKK